MDGWMDCATYVEDQPAACKHAIVNIRRQALVCLPKTYEQFSESLESSL